MSDQREESSVNKPPQSLTSAACVPVVTPPPEPKQGPAFDAQSREQHLLLIRSELISESFSGPLPAPRVLAEFEKILPGLADRIMRMAEKQSVHRQHLERITVEGDNRRSWAGLRAGLAVGLAAIAGTVLLGIFGSPVAASILGSVLGGGTIVGLVSVFVVGKKGRETEREKKAELMTGGKLPSAKQPLPVPATPPHPASPSTQD